MASNVIYTPGVCNIGPEEIKKRYMAGLKGLIVTVILWALLVYFNVPRLWRLTVFFPATLAATGFIQGRMRFCPHFGMAGLFNFGPLGNEQKVTDPVLRAIDRKMSWKIIIYSAIVGAIIAIIGLMLF